LVALGELLFFFETTAKHRVCIWCRVIVHMRCMLSRRAAGVAPALLKTADASACGVCGSNAKGQHCGMAAHVSVDPADVTFEDDVQRNERLEVETELLVKKLEEFDATREKRQQQPAPVLEHPTLGRDAAFVEHACIVDDDINLLGCVMRWAEKCVREVRYRDGGAGGEARSSEEYVDLEVLQGVWQVRRLLPCAAASVCFCSPCTGACSPPWVAVHRL
jgi:hypothetical protein